MKSNLAKNRLDCHFSTENGVNNLPIQINVFGGDPSFIAALSVLDLENPEANGQVYSDWASSVRDFPDVIDQKVGATYVLGVS